ncbi:hypothetical protein ScPMuIL_019010 [Solemya velum]
MPFSNAAAAAEEFKKIKGIEADVGAQFVKAFKIPGVQEVYKEFKGKAVTESMLHSHGALVMKFMIGRLACDGSDGGLVEFIQSHKEKPGVTAALISAPRGVLLETLVEHGLDRPVMETFIDDFCDSLGDW